MARKGTHCQATEHPAKSSGSEATVWSPCPCAAVAGNSLALPSGAARIKMDDEAVGKWSGLVKRQWNLLPRPAIPTEVSEFCICKLTYT